uniref:Uncharacterized protein n=1 Tax=Oryza sativa subsp. japonica TaxID=39947 RepID=Q5Z4H9_ORYSJ|nr:hypothetical protein [Oryza sativa Japonica Group]BAD62353.1 hypothetical protein [Oryza sativa Japonica Group]
MASPSSPHSSRLAATAKPTPTRSSCLVATAQPTSLAAAVARRSFSSASTERKLTPPPCSPHRRHRRLAPLSQRRRIPPASMPTLASPCLPAIVTAFLPPRRRIWTWEELTGLPAPPPAARVAPTLPPLLLSAASSPSAVLTLFSTASVTPPPPPHRPFSPRQL